jgi:hypothetical protein
MSSTSMRDTGDYQEQPIHLGARAPLNPALETYYIKIQIPPHLSRGDDMAQEGSTNCKDHHTRV